MSTPATQRRERLRFRVGSLLRRREATWRILAARRTYRPYLVRPSSEILIDGYFRSANTFCVEAFLSANPTTSVAHHLHSPFQFVRAARFGTPSILLVRQPEEALASELVRAPEKSAGEALDEWIFFHHVVQRVPEAYVVGTFEEVTSDLAAIIQRVNAKFARGFALYHNSSDSDAAAFEAVENYFRTDEGRFFSDEKFGQVVGRPDDRRQEELRAARARIEQDTPPQQLDRARALYNRFVELAEDQRVTL